jgi:hypothetical protein
MTNIRDFMAQDHQLCDSLFEKHIRWHMQAHCLAYGLLLMAVVWPAWFAYPAGLAVVIANGWLLRNLLAAVSVYRSHLAALDTAAG